MERSRHAGTLAVMNGDEIDEPTSDRELALRRLKKERDFQSHVVAYLVVNAAVWAIWAFTGTGYPWPAWLTGLWGIGLVLNAWDVYWRRPITETDVERELERLHAGR
jgi:hypothetical protein